MNEDLSHLHEWLLAFWSDRMMAYHHVTDDVWSVLHPTYIDHELDLTAAAQELICNA